MRLALCLFAFAGLGVLRGDEPRTRPRAAIRCTPKTVTFPGRAAQESTNPIATALSGATAGAVVYLQPGDYPAFTIGFQSSSPANANTSGGEQGLPLVVEGVGEVRVIGAQGDAIAIDQSVPNGWITFKNLVIVPGQRSGVIFYQQQGDAVHRGYTFEDCHILGEFDPASGEGKRAKWGVWGHKLADFRFAGVQAPARIERISDEHAFYLQNPRGPITIENVSAQDLGRTFVQFTARASEGPPGEGDVIVRDCVVEDACINEGDGYKGGAAFTVAGRLECTFFFENNVYRAGFRADRAKLTLPGVPYGTGAFAAWEADRAGMNGTVILRDNRFEFAKGCGDRPVVSIGGCTKVLLVGQNKFVSGGVQPALALDPVNLQKRMISTPNASVYVAPATKLEGALTLAGNPPSDEDFARLQRQGRSPAQDEPADEPRQE
jgi:hypothetical protein